MALAPVAEIDARDDDCGFVRLIKREINVRVSLDEAVISRGRIIRNFASRRPSREANEQFCLWIFRKEAASYKETMVITQLPMH